MATKSATQQVPTPATTGREDLDTALNATGYRWYLDEQELGDIVGKIQHRATDKLNAAQVNAYANQAKAGSTPPPICVTKDGYVVYGNHRVAAAIKAGWARLPAVVIDVPGAGYEADQARTDAFVEVAAIENQPNGVPLDPASRKMDALAMIRNGRDTKAIQFKLGLSSSQISGIRREFEATERLVKIGVDTDSLDVSDSVLRSFSGKDASALNAEPFKALVSLADDADLLAKEVNAIAGDAREADSDEGAMKVISDARDEMSTRIAEKKMGGSVRPTPVNQMRGLLVQVDKLCTKHDDTLMFKDHSDGASAFCELLDDTIECLTSIRKVQDES